MCCGWCVLAVTAFPRCLLSAWSNLASAPRASEPLLPVRDRSHAGVMGLRTEVTFPDTFLDVYKLRLHKSYKLPVAHPLARTQSRCPPLGTVPRLILLGVCHIHHFILLLATGSLFDASRRERCTGGVSELGGVGASKGTLQAATSDLHVSSSCSSGQV